MGVKMQDNEIKVKYKFQRKAGRSIIDRAPVFSPDGESLLVIVENVVRVFNIQTGDCVRTFETESHVDELVGVQFCENDYFNVYACSVTGCVTTWTWGSGAVIRETNLKIPSHMEVQSFNLISSNDCFVTVAGPKDQYLHFALCSVKSGERLYEYRDQTPLFFQNMIRVAIGWCNGERFAAITNGTPVLFIQNLYKPFMFEKISNFNLIRLLSVASHSTENAVAVTDAFGRAIVIRGNLFDSKSVGKEVVHWHHLPATAVCFSTMGNYLYTGGLENVLIKWTIGQLANKHNEKMFIPRLPGNLRFITACNMHVAITLSNNSIVIANPQMKVTCTILECGGLSPIAKALETPLVYHQRLGGLLMGGRTGHLQLYSTTTDKVLYNVDITGLNNTSAERYNLIPIQTEVTCVAISGNGSWLVTSEYRNDGITYPEERLKFWTLQIKQAIPFTLNTCVNLSHAGCKVVSLTLSTRGDLCVSAGGDQKFRIWKKEITGQKQKKRESWSCLTACYYASGTAHISAHDIFNRFKIDIMPPGKDEEYPYWRDYRDENDILRKIVNIHKEHSLVQENVFDFGIKKDDENDMGGVAISHDGSLIAAWFGCKLTLWDTHLCNLRTSLSHPALRPKGKDVTFANYDAAHHLVCTTDTCLAVWSLLSLTVKWIVKIHPTCLVADPLSNRLAIATTNNDVYVFTPHSSTPILSHTNILSTASGVFKRCTFGSTNGDEIRLYLMRNDSEIYSLEPEQTDQGRLEVLSHANLPTSNFGALLADQQTSEVKATTGGAIHETSAEALGNRAINQFLSGAPHMVPSIGLLCSPFLLQLFGKEEDKSTEEADTKVMEIDESSDDDDLDDKEDRTYAPKPTQLWTPNYEKVKEKRLLKITKVPLLDLHVTETLFGA